MKPGDHFIEVDHASGYLVRYEMEKNRSWSARPMRLVDVVASEKTVEEARTKVAEAIQLYLENQRENGWKVPDPESPLEEQQLERDRFDKAMGVILTVSKEEVDRRLAAAKSVKTGKRYPKEEKSP